MRVCAGPYPIWRQTHTCGAEACFGFPLNQPKDSSPERERERERHGLNHTHPHMGFPLASL